MITDILNTVVTGIIAGVVSSATFHVILKRTVPKIKISDKIEKRIVNGQAKYHIKIVNLRRRFVVNVAPYLDLAHSENGPDGTILRLKKLDIHSEDVPYIDPYKRQDTECKYAVRVELTEQLESIWTDDQTQFLQVQIYCADEFSGSGKLFSQKYFSHNCIVEGKFKTGKSLDIVT